MRTLVAYFSAEDHTKRVAEIVSNQWIMSEKEMQGGLEGMK